MRPEMLTLIYSLILCIVSTVVSSGVSVCSTDGMSIRGGEYSLSNGSNVGSELLYHCPDGYYPYPKLMHRCLGHNRWSPSPSRRGSECRGTKLTMIQKTILPMLDYGDVIYRLAVMTCPDPSELRNGEVSPVLLQYVVGAQTTYECHDGYAFAGSASRVCQSNGKWSGDTPICDHGSGHCRDPGVPPGAKRNGNMLDIGDRVTYECSLGLMLLGSKERICLEGGDWSGTEPVCYSKNYYDTPEEVSKYFSTSLENRLAISGLDDNNIYVFGVGAKMNEEEINKLVSKKSSEKHFYKLRDDTKLTSLFKMIIDESNSVDLCGLSWDRDGDDSTTSKRQEYPWVVTISVLVGNEHSSCMGALVTPRFVLTAAHCFRDKQIDMIKVKVFDQEDMTLEQKPIIHPDYDVFKKKDKGVSEFYDYDVALLKLSSDVQRSKYIRPICIPCTISSIRASGLHTSTTCKAQEEFLLNQNSVPARFMSEWKGQMYEKDVQIKLKEKRESCIKDAEEAEGIKNYKEAVTKNFLCTGGTEDKVEDIACKGDSGGALYLKNLKRRIQVGVISWGVKDLCMGNIPKPLSTATTRDYHINLFRMQKFLKEHLGEKKNETNYEPLKFVD
ncbi:complement factor B/C2 isoform X4 [Oncorhynchus mykiss]|uniref:complement factor B/C2 isoform X4 n=1 Tax=Oncorhynchus mykiss TaxID=8022 RepID=UPI000B4EA1EC|nr:complement factor B/C2 isoform X4 [Oncorhynchus mykiss]